MNKAIEDEIAMWLRGALVDPDDTEACFRLLYGTDGEDRLRAELEAGREPADAMRATLEWAYSRPKQTYEEFLRSSRFYR